MPARPFSVHAAACQAAGAGLRPAPACSPLDRRDWAWGGEPRDSISSGLAPPGPVSAALQRLPACCWLSQHLRRRPLVPLRGRPQLPARCSRTSRPQAAPGPTTMARCVLTRASGAGGRGPGALPSSCMPGHCLTCPDSTSPGGPTAQAAGAGAELAPGRLRRALPRCRRPKRQCVLPDLDLVQADGQLAGPEVHDSHRRKRQAAAPPRPLGATPVPAAGAQAGSQLGPVQVSAQAARCADAPPQPPGQRRQPQPQRSGIPAVQHSLQHRQAAVPQPGQPFAGPGAPQQRELSQPHFFRSAQQPWPGPPGVRQPAGTTALASAQPAGAVGQGRSGQAPALPAAAAAWPRLAPRLSAAGLALPNVLLPGYPARPPRPASLVQSGARQPGAAAGAPSAAAAQQRAGSYAASQPGQAGAAHPARMHQGAQPPLPWAGSMQYATAPHSMPPGLAASAMRAHALPHQPQPAGRMMPLSSRLGAPHALSDLCGHALPLCALVPRR